MKFKKLKNIFITIAGLLFLFPVLVNAKNNSNENGKRKLAKSTAGQIGTAALNINNINSLQSNTGYSDYNPDSNKEGTEFPRNTAKNAIYESGFLWGGYPNGNTSQVYVGGSAYRSGLQPGPILSDGTAADPTDPRWSIYRVRPDVYPDGPSVDLSSDAASESYWDPANPVTADQVKAQYESDWANWPAAGTTNDLGAPFTDKNNDGIYEPDIDIPGVPGADQTIFYVANDENSNLTTTFYGAQPLGLEVHVTIWAYAQQGALGNMYFKKFDIINKGNQNYTIDSMFVSWWADVDLGSSSDDLVGNDSTLSLTYVYNGQPTDATYAPLPPPAVGADFFQGPIVDGSPTDSAIFNGRIIYGKKNLPMTAAYTFTNPGSGLDATYNDPDQGQASGSTQFYNFFNGENRIGTPYADPNTGKTTKFIFPGDPVARSGWIDGNTFPPRDVRSGMASGPFTMAPGDTQEVVVAEVIAGAVPSVSYSQAITLLKVYDKTAQNAYDHFFNLPSAPPAPQVAGIPQNNKIVLNWGTNLDKVSSTENTVIHDLIDSVDVSGGGDYKFEGYNVYQLPYFGASKDQAKLVATYDVINGVSSIPFTDPVTRTVEPSIIIQNGTDSGIKRYFVDSVDVFNGNKPLNNGSPYYFAVTAYSYNPKGVPQSLENPIAIVTVTPQANAPGVTTTNLGNSNTTVEHSGLADATVSVKVIDPLKVTGHQYQITFHNEMYSLGSDGKWTDITAMGKKLRKIKDLTGSSLTATASWSETKGAFAIHYLVDVESPDFDYCDGVELKLPSNIIIDSIYKPISNNDGSEIEYTYNPATNSVFFGDSSRSQNGLFAGGEDIIITSKTANLPIITNYNMYDDNYGGGLIDVSGIDTVTTIANMTITQKQWNVKDLATGNDVIKNQTILSGKDVYAPDVYFSENSVNGPGGSSGSKTTDLGTDANLIFEGIQVSINGSYGAPITIGNLINNISNNSSYDLEDFLGFGYADATAATTLPVYGGIGGTTNINQLQQDYELKWTGVDGDTVINGHHVAITKSGGSIATLFGASNYSLGIHPLNPNPGSTNPFTVKIPFEVWNTTKNEQVNLLVYDRNYNSTNDPTKDDFSVWNQNDRVYVWVLNTKYSTSVINPNSQIVADSATWNWVFFESKFTTGDDIKITYNNPIQVGHDTFTFSVPKADTSLAQAKSDVNKINVFPNPYYGVNYLETSKYSRFVTFNHLPEDATIRIFNLAGIQVKVLNHYNGQFEKWDLTNESQLPVASGLYIAYIDMPKVGTTRILKFSIIQEQQIPDHF